MIRKYKDNDLNDILKIWLDASIVSHNFIEEIYWVSKLEDMKQVYIPKSKTYIYQDEETKEVLGFVSMVNNYLAAIFVHPQHWGKGIGRALMEKVKSEHTKIELNVYAKNARSVSFYEHHGFTVVQEKIDENTGHLELSMVFEL